MKRLLGVIGLIALAAFVQGAMTLDWPFFALSIVASAAIIIVGVKAAGWSAVNPFVRATKQPSWPRAER